MAEEFENDEVEDLDDLMPPLTPSPASSSSRPRYVPEPRVKPPPAAAPGAGELRPGGSVRVTGLSGAAHLNGSTGRLVSKDVSTGRWLVELDTGPEKGATKALKLQNLETGQVGFKSQESPPLHQSMPGPKFSPGDRVRVVGLDSRSELNNVRGVIVSKHAEMKTRYHVRLDGDLGDKLLKARNLELAGLESTPNKFAQVTKLSPSVPTARAAPAEAAVAKARPTASSARAVPQGSAPTPQPPKARPAPARPMPSLREVLQAAKPGWMDKDLNNVVEKLSKAQVTTFAHLRDAVRDKADALNDRLRAAGQKAFVGETLRALKQRVDFEVQADQKAQAAQAAQAEPPISAVVLEPADLPVLRFQVVHDLAMIREEPSLGARAVNRKDRGEVVEGVEESFDGFVKLSGKAGWCSKDMQGKLGMGKLLEPLPRQQPAVLAAEYLAGTPGPQTFEVIFKPTVAVRSAPSMTASIVSARLCGEVVLAVSQTYHGWLRLDGDAGWMLSKHPQHGVLLRPTFEKALPQVEPAPPTVGVSDTDQMIQETLQRHREEKSAMGAKDPSAGDDGGAAAARAAEAETRRQEEQQQKARLEAEKQQRAREEEFRARKLEEEKRKKAEEEEFRARKLQEENRKKADEEALIRRHEEEKRIREAERKKEDEARQRAEQAQRQQEEAAAAKSASAQSGEQESLLAAFVEAARSGEPGVIKSARDACKKAGVPTKEIARVFALAQQQMT